MSISGEYFEDHLQGLIIGLFAALIISVIFNIVIGCKCKNDCCIESKNYTMVDSIGIDECQTDDDDLIENVQ